jgi:hypothetical protein
VIPVESLNGFEGSHPTLCPYSQKRSPGLLLLASPVESFDARCGQSSGVVPLGIWVVSHFDEPSPDEGVACLLRPHVASAFNASEHVPLHRRKPERRWFFSRYFFKNFDPCFGWSRGVIAVGEALPDFKQAVLDENVGGPYVGCSALATSCG